MIRIERFVSPGMIVASGKLWSAGLTRGRTKKCELCDGCIVSGDRAYRPVGEGRGVVRCMRICCACVCVFLDGARARKWWGISDTGTKLHELRARAVGTRRASD